MVSICSPSESMNSGKLKTKTKQIPQLEWRRNLVDQNLIVLSKYLKIKQSFLPIILLIHSLILRHILKCILFLFVAVYVQVKTSLSTASFP